MRPDLGGFLVDAANRKRQAAVWDCCAMPAAWIMACGHGDPMAEWREAYTSEAQAAEFLAEAGGLAAVVSAAMRRLPGTAAVDFDDLRAGDVGVVSALGEQAGAVYTGKRWALVAEQGLFFSSFNRREVLAAWRV